MSVALGFLFALSCAEDPDAALGDGEKEQGAGGATTTGGGTASAGGSTQTGSGGDSTAGGASGAGEATLGILLDTTSEGADVSDDVSAFPLAIALEASHFDFARAAEDGADLRFVQGTVELDYEVELWDAAGATALVWVKVPVISGNTAAQLIELRYGSGQSNTDNDPAAVFSTEDGFHGVFHLGEDGGTTPGGYRDSSGHGAHATGVNMIPGSSVPARLGRGSRLQNPEGQDTPRYVQVSGEKATAFNPDGPLTVSVWALAHSYPIYSYETIMSKGDTSWSLQRVTYEPNTGYQSCLLAGSGTTYHFCIYDFASQPLVTDEWLHFHLVLDEPTMTLFINGEQNSSGTGFDWNQGDHPLGIGSQTQFDGRRQWDGILDEARVMRAKRSAAWARLDYQSQRDGQTLVTYVP